MNDVATNTLWTEPTEVEEATDAWQEYLERELGLRFHGVNSMASSTIAHRFVIDDADGSLLLRVRRDGDHKIVLECVAVGTVETTDAQIAALRDDARRVLASAAWSARNEFTPVTADLTSLVGGLTLDLITAAAVAAVFGSLNTALRKLDLSRFAGIRVAEITSRERDELQEALLEASEPVQAALALSERASPSDAAQVQPLLVRTIGGTIGVGEVFDQSTGALEYAMASNPAALLEENSFESTVAHFLSDVDLAIGEWERVATRPSAPAGGQGVREDQLANVLAKLEAQTQFGERHVTGLIELGHGRRVRVFYSRRSGGLPAFVAARIRRSLFLNREEFDRLVECSLTREEYLTLVLGRLAS